jgi:CRP/FNR family transcriptional regulator, cyclic AMP receptor protein
MTCKAEDLRQIPLFALLDDDEMAVLAAQVEIKTFASRQRIYKIGEPGKHAYVMISGKVQVTTVDQAHQEVLVDEPRHGDFFGFASMLEDTPHQTTALAIDECVCLEVSRDDIAALVQQKPMAGMDMLTVVSRQFHALQQLVRLRASRNSNDVIEEKMSFGDRIADVAARFGGSWTFIILFGVLLLIYTTINTALRTKAWDPYPFILLNLFLSMLAAIQAPVIMMSQNRQDTKDRVRGELDYDVNLRAESEIQTLSSKLNLLNEKIGDVDDLLREHIDLARQANHPS